MPGARQQFDPRRLQFNHSYHQHFDMSIPGGKSSFCLPTIPSSLGPQQYDLQTKSQLDCQQANNSILGLGILVRKQNCIYDRHDRPRIRSSVARVHFDRTTSSSSFWSPAIRSILGPWPQYFVLIAKESIINHWRQNFILIAKQLDPWRQEILGESLRIAYNNPLLGGRASFS